MSGIWASDIGGLLGSKIVGQMLMLNRFVIEPEKLLRVDQAPARNVRVETILISSMPLT